MSDRLTEIEARRKAATPGPWQEGVAGNTNVVQFDGFDIRGIAAVPGPANRDFIARAPEDIDWLVAKVKEQAEEIKRLRGEEDPQRRHGAAHVARPVEGKV